MAGDETRTPSVQHEHLESSPELSDGSVVAGYRIERLRSIGGFGTVYRAVHVESGHPAALKVLHSFLATEERTVRRFLQEAAMIGQLNHPNIVSLFDYGILEGSRPYLVTEWLEGRDLDEVLLRGPLPVDETLRILGELCDALGAVHSQGIVHRDIKASNLMLVSAGSQSSVKLLDFGLAKIYDESLKGREALTRTGTRLGTPQYMAPEAILGHPIDPRTDIYSLGVLLFEMLTARRPFEASTPVEIQELHLYAPRPRAGQMVRLPPVLDDVIVKCMARNRADRYPDAAAVLEAARVAVRSGSQGEGIRQRVGTVCEPTIGLHVEAWVTAADDDVEDATLDDLEDSVALLQILCKEAGAEIVTSEAQSFLAALALPAGSAREGLDARASALSLALELWKRFDERPEADARVQLAVSVHVASVVSSSMPGLPQFLGGDLLCLGDWKPDHERSEVVATVAALAGLEDRFEIDRAPARLGCSRVLRGRGG